MPARRKTVANKRSASTQRASKAASRSAATRTAAKKTAAKKTAAKKTVAKKTVARKTAAKKTAAKKTAAKKTVARKTAAKKTVAKKTAAKKTAAKKTAAKKTAATRTKGPKRAPAGRGPKLKPVGKRARTVGAVPPAPTSSKRNFGLRGAAPWVARHAAKHAEELRRRNAEPPPPGSARATLRVPHEAEHIKTQVGQLHQLVTKIASLRKRLDKTFYEIGDLLYSVQRDELFVAKGYASFEAFLDREIELPRSVSLRLIRICQTFQRDTAYDFGLERLTAALSALDGEVMTAVPSHPSSRGWSSMPPRPPIRFDD